LKKKDDLHIEITFNRRGDTGQIDMANIDDIQMETQLSAVDNKSGGTELKRLWISFLTGIEYSIVRNGQSKAYTAKDGSEYVL
jgi:malate synthase